MRSLILIFFIFSSYSVIAKEGIQGEINVWDGTGFAQVYITYPDKSITSFQAVIDDDPDGKEIVDLHYIRSKHDNCTAENIRLLSDVVMKINGKRVKMKTGCKRLGLMNILRYFAATKEGRSPQIEI